MIMHQVIKTAFTLIELLVVIAIIGILSGLIIVTMNGVTAKANIAKSQVFSNSLRNALMMNLISEWKLDGSAADSWGGKNGTIHGTTAVASGCPQGTCLSFGGTDYINVADNSVFNFGSRATAMIWIKGLEQDKGYFSQNDGGASQRSWALSTVSNKYFRVLLSGSGNVADKDYRSSTVFLNNEWHYVGFTWNTGLLKLYVDGVEVGVSKITDNSITSIYDSSSDIVMGCSLSSGAPINYFIGHIDEAKLYNEAMPSYRIRENYYAGLNGLLANGSMSKEEYLSRIGGDFAKSR